MRIGPGGASPSASRILAPLLSTVGAEEVAERLLARGARFRDRLLEGLDAAGFDLTDPAEVLLALRRIGPGQLEALFAEPDPASAPVASPFIDEIEVLARAALAGIGDEEKEVLRQRRPRVLVATTDVHFYGKRLLDTVLGRLGVELVDGGVSVDPDVLAARAAESEARAVAVSTYNGVALSFVQRLRGELAQRRIAPIVFVGGRLNEIMEDTGSSLPVEVTDELRQGRGRALPERRRSRAGLGHGGLSGRNRDHRRRAPGRVSAARPSAEPGSGRAGSAVAPGARRRARRFAWLRARPRQRRGGDEGAADRSHRPAGAGRRGGDRLPWRAGQVMVSACAGVPLARLRPLVAPATVVRAMPISAVAVCASPTVLYPDEPRARALFARLGEVLPLRDEGEFEVATVSAAVYGWVHDLIGRSAAWSEAAGLDPTTARRLAAMTFSAAARMIVADEEKSVAALVASLATPEALPREGLGVLQEREVAPAWDAACDAVLAHLRRTGERRG
jgi:methylmalonyl-CoA mutase cobalamin-binding subunit